MYKLSSVCADKASENIKTSIPNVVTVIHTANPNCVYCVQSISLADVQSSGRGGLSAQKNERIHIHINSKILLLLLIVHKPYMLMTTNTLTIRIPFDRCTQHDALKLNVIL